MLQRRRLDHYFSALRLSANCQLDRCGSLKQWMCKARQILSPYVVSSANTGVCAFSSFFSEQISLLCPGRPGTKQLKLYGQFHQWHADVSQTWKEIIHHPFCFSWCNIFCTRKKLQQHWWSSWTCSAYSLTTTKRGKEGSRTLPDGVPTPFCFARERWPALILKIWTRRPSNWGLRIVQVRLCLLRTMWFQLHLATISLVPSHTRVKKDCYMYMNTVNTTWSIARLAFASVCLFVCLFVCLLFVCLLDWLADSLIDWLVGWEYALQRVSGIVDCKIQIAYLDSLQCQHESFWSGKKWNYFFHS